jgi:hypothetical protein
MFLESRERILAQIEEIIAAAEDRSDILRGAVAFWGVGSQLLIKDRASYNLVCNLEHPGTNPFVVEKIMAEPNVTFLQHNDLHAKVVIGSAGAVVGSANFSERALGIQMGEVAGWIEAAVLVRPEDAAHAKTGMWFERLWHAARSISQEDIDRAKSNWLARGRDPLGATPELVRYHPSVDPDLKGPALCEEDVFEAEPLDEKLRKKTRMASAELLELYQQTCQKGIRRNEAVKVAAHSANLLWVLSGREMGTNIEGIPAFKTPDMVIERSRKLGTFKMMHTFIQSLANNPQAKPAIRFWAQYYLTLESGSLGLYRLAAEPE